MLLHTISPSNIFTQFSDSPTFRKSDFISSFSIQITTKSKKNLIIKCFKNQIERETEQEAAKDKQIALAEWLSSTKPAEAIDTCSNPAPPFKSVGTRSAPSRPSIQGQKSKYSKYSPFSPSSRPRSHGEGMKPYKKPSERREPSSWMPKNHDPNTTAAATLKDDGREVVFGNNGLAYKFPEAPFEFQYSYTETPKVKPLALREAAFVPFGPTTMPRPWTGRAPLPPSKKKMREFDSFKLPPPNKKGVKHIQPPGPYRPGQGPKYVKRREEVLGEPLTKDEVKQLLESSCHSDRQLNIGRDGLTHNMLDNIHAHWKRRRVCKIKCKGVATVDMDNVCNQLEDKTGGKVIHRAGGVVYLFRGRNYNYKTRPVFPLMLWKPVSAVYPKLIERAPGGLTVEEANGLRRRGKSLLPICKLAKNGVYLNLVQDVRDAFKVSELVRIDCQGLKASDFKKIGAKLKDLVPCVLLSFEYEHILMWRGKDWKPDEQGAGAPEAHSEREFSIADSLNDTTRSTVMTTLPSDEKSGYEYLAFDYARAKENVLEKNSMPSKNVADGALGDKNGITPNFEKATGLQLLVEKINVTSDGEVDSLEGKNDTSSSSEVELEESIERSEVEIITEEELGSGVSLSVAYTGAQLLVEDSAYNSQTPSCSKVELEELTESSELELLCHGRLDSSVSVSATATDEQGLREDSAYNSQISDVQFFYGGDDKAMSASNHISEDRDALSKAVDGVSYNQTDLKNLTESFIPAAETSMVSEEFVESADEESSIKSDEESNLCLQLKYADEINGQENDGTFDDEDGNEFIANSTLETTQKEGVSLHIEVLWEQAIALGRLMFLDESALDPDVVHEKAIAFAKNAPAGPFFKRRFSRKKVSKPWKNNSVVKTSESEGQKPARSISNNGTEEISHSSDDLPRGGLQLHELARLLAQ